MHHISVQMRRRRRTCIEILSGSLAPGSLCEVCGVLVWASPVVPTPSGDRRVPVRERAVAQLPELVAPGRPERAVNPRGAGQRYHAVDEKI